MVIQEKKKKRGQKFYAMKGPFTTSITPIIVEPVFTQAHLYVLGIRQCFNYSLLDFLNPYRRLGGQYLLYLISVSDTLGCKFVFAEGF